MRMNPLLRRTCNHLMVKGLPWVFALAFLPLVALAASEPPHEGSTSPAQAESDPLMEHVLDAHAWHLFDLPNGTPVSLNLPIIAFHEERGLEVFVLDAHDHHAMHHELHTRGYTINELNQLKDAHHPELMVVDFSITKTVLHMMLMALLLFFVLRAVAKGYRKREGEAPKGIQSLLEPVIVFVREDIARPNLGAHASRYMSFLLTVFFFIWFSNLFGLTPLNSNIMGNISVTAALAFVTFIITTLSGTKAYWAHIVWFPGVALPIKLLMLPIEIVGMFTKPFALMIRLFANIAAGHFMTVALVLLIFMLSEYGKNPAAGYGTAVFSIAFSLFIFAIELLVAALQAYVFTMLSAVFIGQALESGHEDH